MKTSTIVWIVVVVLVVAAGVWWFTQGGSESAPPSSATTSQTSDTTGSQTVIIGTDAEGNEYLEGASGMTLYTYAKDTSGTSTCSGSCASAWPPYMVVAGQPLTPDPVATGTLSTITRSDGTLQLTYNGMPLYFYTQDVNPGDTNGASVSGWSLAKP